MDRTWLSVPQCPPCWNDLNFTEGFSRQTCHNVVALKLCSAAPESQLAVSEAGLLPLAPSRSRSNSSRKTWTSSKRLSRGTLLPFPPLSPPPHATDTACPDSPPLCTLAKNGCANLQYNLHLSPTNAGVGGREKLSALYS